MGFQFYTHLLCLPFKTSHFIFKNNLDLVCNLFRYLHTWLVSIIIFKRTLLSYWTKKGIKCWVLTAAWHVQFEIDIKLLTFVEFYIHLPQNLLLYFAYFVCHIDMHHVFLFKMCRLISVRLWNFKDGGSKKARILAKNQHTWREKNEKIPLMNDGLSKNGHDFRK